MADLEAHPDTEGVWPQEQEEHLHAAKGKAEMYEARAGRALLQVNAIRGAVTNLFGAADCEISAAQEVLATGPVGPFNLMQYLGIVEQKVDQTLRVCRPTMQTNLWATDLQYEAVCRLLRAEIRTFSRMAVIG